MYYLNKKEKEGLKCLFVALLYGRLDSGIHRIDAIMDALVGLPLELTLSIFNKEKRAEVKDALGSAKGRIFRFRYHKLKEEAVRRKSLKQIEKFFWFDITIEYLNDMVLKR